MTNDKKIIYRINQEDIIYSIEGPWDDFASKNDGIPENISSNILGNVIWKYIRDFETKHIYKLLLDHVRLFKKEITIPIRCDAPHLKRYIDLTIKPISENKIEFVSHIKKEEKRENIDILDKKIKRNDKIIKMCSYCKFIKTNENTWMEISEAINHLRLLQKDTLPTISHGICPSCYTNIMQELENYKLSYNR